jgi:YVTN family beta-propeller protein
MQISTMRAWLLGCLLFPGLCLAQTLVVVNKADNDVSLIDLPSGQTLARVPVGVGPHEVALDADGSTAFISNYGGFQVPGNSVSRIDLASAQVDGTFDLGAYRRPHGIVMARNSLWVTSELSDTLLELSPENGSLRSALSTAQSMSHMVAVDPRAEYAYVANIDSDSISKFDLQARQLQAIKLTGRGAEGIAVSPDGREVWVAHQDASEVAVIDAATLAILARIPVHGRPIRVAFTPDGSRVLVSCMRTGDLAVIGRAVRREVARIDFGRDAPPGWNYGAAPNIVGLMVSPDGRYAYVSITAITPSADASRRGTSRMGLPGRHCGSVRREDVRQRLPLIAT